MDHAASEVLTSILGTSLPFAARTLKRSPASAADALPTLQKQLPGSRILDGAFQTTGVAIAVQKERPAALAYVKDFVESAKANGIVRRAFDDAGLNRLPVAP